MPTLLSWLGKTDLDNMSQDSSAAIASIALKHEQPFEQILILANAWDEKWHQYEEWLKRRLATLSRPTEVKIVRAHINSPIDYPSIGREADKYIGKLANESDQLFINLTSGTPAMTALSVVLGKAKENVHFVQATPDNKLIYAEIDVDFSRVYNKSAAHQAADRATKVPKPQAGFEKLISESSKMQQVVTTASNYAKAEVPVLILGETGTGKEVMANAIHQSSFRANQPFKIVNCGALPENLVDSILFGHVKGAFTGAQKDHKGLFESADGGTLFLDEVGELKPDTQVKLLRALQQGEITRVGDNQTRTVDVRIIAATHRNLINMVDTGEFREDLFYRLAIGVIELPPLRERNEDIAALAQHLLAEINDNFKQLSGFKSKKISENGIKFIESQAWPGNIRELWSTLHRAVLTTESAEIGADTLKNSVIKRQSIAETESISLSYGDSVDVNFLIEKYKKKYVLAALKASGYKLTEATKMLGLNNHQTLKSWMEKLNIELPK
ncbi:sigma 54-interacting transcriptional regulator [Neiella marina]|uniref:Sigma 54-interacting transcriptional regulator n=1 Tax=Neiella holothuriorum TaxID=2870530 RepID=A0ABS7EDF2_9GAMM|nr:sigma-54 dependent transcriptional regulator [Neiella holothuriorum]MBW8190290.1 sigma 54-interacting transcriptional regulator [Neiella holothuriorum]